jgi:flagella basal body P-ring formation protein FlgA
MSRRVRNAGLLAIACLAAASFAGAADTDAALEQKLRAARPEILRWQTGPMSAAAARARREVEIVAIGPVAARTPVRFADGHVAWFAVSGFRPVLVSTRRIDAREAVGVQDTALADTDVVSLGCEPLVSFDATQRWRATRRLTTGAPLCANGLEPVPDVERDRPVTLSARRGAVSVSRVFIAATDAHAGERVRLRDRASGATIIAIVTGPGLARDAEWKEER